MNTTIRILVAATAILAACMQAFVCDMDHESLDIKNLDLSWIHSDLAVFGVDERGLGPIRSCACFAV